MDDNEMMRIISNAGVLKDKNGQSAAFEMVRPSELDDLHKRYSTSAKLVELDEDDIAVGEGRQPGVSGHANDGIDNEDVAVISDFGEEMFRLLLYTIVFGTLWLCMDMMVHSQYSQEITWAGQWQRALNVLPGLVFTMYMTSHFPNKYLTHLVLFGFSTIGGAHMIHIVNKATYMAVIRKAPALGTLWIWSVVQMDLTTTLASLICVGAYVKYAGLNLILAS